jgi:hypothetical protein
MTRRTVLALMPVFIAAACRWAAPPVQMYGTETALERLAGQWSGEYIGDASHRRNGNIAFTLKPGTHEAQGDVMMVPDGASPYRRYEPEDSHQGTPHSTNRFLSIRFVEVERGTVRGRLDLYWDPDRLAAATSQFVGRISDDVIEGTFTTTYGNGDPATGGTWRVRRVRK